METDQNEDPEDLLEREQLERSNRWMRDVAIKTGEASLAALLALFFPSIIGIALIISLGGSGESSALVSLIGLFSLGFLAVCAMLAVSLASMVSLVLVTRLACRGEKGLKNPLFMAIPGALVSLILAVTCLLISMKPL